MKKVVVAAVAHTKSMVDGEFFKDTFAEHPDDRINYKHDLTLDEKYGGAKSIRGMMDFLQRKSESENLGWPNIEYHRLPCADEKALPMVYFDEIRELVVRHARAGDSKLATIFNCQMGKGRTTTGQVVATMIFHVLRSKDMPLNENMAELHPAVREICASVKGGEAAMALANMAIDVCDEMQNLRECVAWAWDKHDNEGKADKKSYWIGMAENFIQRYCFLVLFGDYCLTCGTAPHYFNEQTAPFPSFSAFINARSPLMVRLA